MVCRECVLKEIKKQEIEMQVYTRMQSNQSNEQLGPGRLAVDHPGLSVIHMTDRINEGFVVSFKS